GGGAGEIAHMVVNPGGDLCYCGRRGCLATVVQGDRIVKEIRRSHGGRVAPAEFDFDVLDAPGMLPSKQLEMVVQWAQRGDPISTRVLGDAGYQLGMAVANVCQILNPQGIV